MLFECKTWGVGAQILVAMRVNNQDHTVPGPNSQRVCGHRCRYGGGGGWELGVSQAVHECFSAQEPQFESP